MYEAVAKSLKITVTELGRKLGIPKATIHKRVYAPHTMEPWEHKRLRRYAKWSYAKYYKMAEDRAEPPAHNSAQ